MMSQGVVTVEQRERERKKDGGRELLLEGLTV
jgi:hypothetical protein